MITPILALAFTKLLLWRARTIKPRDTSLLRLSRYTEFCLWSTRKMLSKGDYNVVPTEVTRLGRLRSMRSTKGTSTGSCAQKHTDTNPSNATNTGYLGSLCRSMRVDSLVLSSTGKIWCLVDLTLSSESVRRLPLPLPLVTKICLRFLLLLLYSREEKTEGFCIQYHGSYGVRWITHLPI